MLPAPSIPSGTQWSVQTIRVVTIDDQPWFVAMDVCPVLGLAQHKGSYAHHLQRLDVTERKSTPRSELGYSPGAGISIISESGLRMGSAISRTQLPIMPTSIRWFAS
ncbi:BRO family protein [Paramagnetospirillum magnetotacticum]|uniref:BRO family protein n=1 Tax=Paramagnetospirillum magnetotacticum TaxID=188 RepID=UPI0038990711